MSSANKHTLEELCTLVDIPKRTVRFYIENGVVDRPDGVKKGAYYSQKHVEQLLEIKKWQKTGLSLERIKSLFSDKYEPPQQQREPGDVDVWSHIYISDGVELLIEPKRSGLSSEQVNQIYQTIRAIIISNISPLNG